MRLVFAVNWKVLSALIAGFASAVSARALPVEQGAAAAAGTQGSTV